MNLKDFFHYNKGTRSAVILLLILIVLTLILNALLSQKKSSEFVLSQNDSIIKEFAESRESSKSVDYTTSRGSQTLNKESIVSRRNRCTSYTTRNSTFSNSDSIHQESNVTNYPRIEKLKAGELISLNETDTTQWKKIPGIGSSYASRIIKYKNLLGGYVYKEQLMEVYGVDSAMYSRIEKYIVADSNYIKLNVNELELRDLLRHPYLDYEQVKTIVNLRERKGRINSIKELSMLSEFTKEDIERLKPYLQFN